MKITQYIATVCDTAENAKASVEEQINNDTPSWIYHFAISPDAVISREESPEEYADIIKKCLQERRWSFERAVAKIQTPMKTIDELLNQDIDICGFKPDTYAIAKCLDIILGEWNMNSGFYDTWNMTVCPEHALNDPEDEFDKWYLVPVDFYF